MIFKGSYCFYRCKIRFSTAFTAARDDDDFSRLLPQQVRIIAAKPTSRARSRDMATQTSGFNAVTSARNGNLLLCLLIYCELNSLFIDLLGIHLAPIIDVPLVGGSVEDQSSNTRSSVSTIATIASDQRPKQDTLAGFLIVACI